MTCTFFLFISSPHPKTSFLAEIENEVITRGEGVVLFLPVLPILCNNFFINFLVIVAF